MLYAAVLLCYMNRKWIFGNCLCACLSIIESHHLNICSLWWCKICQMGFAWQGFGSTGIAVTTVHKKFPPRYNVWDRVVDDWLPITSQASNGGMKIASYKNVICISHFHLTELHRCGCMPQYIHNAVATIYLLLGNSFALFTKESIISYL